MFSSLRLALVIGPKRQRAGRLICLTEFADSLWRSELVGWQLGTLEGDMGSSTHVSWGDER